MRRIQRAAIAITLVGGPASPFAGSVAAIEQPAAGAERKDASIEAGDGSGNVPAKDESKSSSQGPYARLLSAELKRLALQNSVGGAGGWIEVAFVVGSVGRVVSFEVRSSSSPLLEPEVRRIMATLRTPPPPGGLFRARQTFHFREHKYVRILRDAIGQRMPKTFAPGSVTANFHLNASGHVDDVKIARASSREHAEMVRKVLSGLKVPPPPGGAANLTEVFFFQ